jgi:hypothetical protein
MIGMPAGTRIWIVAGVTDLRRGFTGLSGMVQTALAENPFSGQVFVFRGKRGDLIKVLWWSGDARARKIHLAASNERSGVADAGAAVDVAGGNRLAASGAQLWFLFRKYYNFFAFPFSLRASEWERRNQCRSYGG